jgi:hypothetical protein
MITGLRAETVQSKTLFSVLIPQKQKGQSEDQPKLLYYIVIFGGRLPCEGIHHGVLQQLTLSALPKQTDSRQL